MSDQQSVASTSRPGSPVGPLPDFANNRPYRFAWDGAGRKQGPPSLSGTSEGRGDYFAYKPTLGNLNFSSASLALGAIPQEWSSAKLGFNGALHIIATYIHIITNFAMYFQPFRILSTVPRRDQLLQKLMLPSHRLSLLNFLEYDVKTSTPTWRPLVRSGSSSNETSNFKVLKMQAFHFHFPPSPLRLPLAH